MKLSELYAPLAPVERIIQSKIVRCDGCAHCCTKGMIWVLPSEVKSVRALGCNVIQCERDGRKGRMFFISRNEPKCPMLDMVQQRCNIYEERPLCCRLFPLDIRCYPGEFRKWMLFDTCPDKRMSNSNILNVLVRAIEFLLPPHIFNELTVGSGEIGVFSLLDSERKQYTIVRQVEAPRASVRFPANIR